MDSLAFEPMLITDVFETMRAAQKWFDLSKANRVGTAFIPYVGRSGGSNGIGTFLPNQGFNAPNDGNAITIGVSTATVFYQPVPFYTSKEVQVLRHSDLNSYNGPVLVAILREQMGKFKWGNGASLERLMATRIMVTVTTDNDFVQVVDWQGMTRLGEELSAEARARARLVYQTDVADNDMLPDLDFEPMFITDVFETMRASSAWYDKSKLIKVGEGRYPFVSRTRAGNGVDGSCVRQAKDPEPGSAVTIGLDTQTIAYQPAAFYTSQNIQVLRHQRLTEETGLFLATVISQQMRKFSWGGNGATLGRLSKTRIMVPMATDDVGEKVVDWDGMRRYGRALRVRAERSIDDALGEG